MSFDATKDKCIQKWIFGNESEPGAFIVGVYSYDNGPRKLGMTRTIKDCWKTGATRFVAAGRLDWDDVQNLTSKLAEIEAVLDVL